MYIFSPLKSHFIFVGLKEDRKSNDPLNSSNGGCQPIKSKILCQRMASDTDLWMNLKAAQAKYQSKLDASKENTSVDTIDDMELVVNQVDMPSLCEYQESELAKSSHRSQATPPDKRQLNQEEFDRYKVNFIMTIIIYYFCNLQQKCNQFLKLYDS